MQLVAGAIIVLAGAVLVAAGIIADGFNRGQGSFGTPGYVMGFIVGLVGVATLFAGALKRAWDAIPIDQPPK